MTSLDLDAWCRGVHFASRTETEVVLAWIEEVVGPGDWADIEGVTW